MFDPGDGAVGEAARGGRLASVASLVRVRSQVVSPGALDAPGEGASGVGGGVSGALRGAGRARPGDARGVGGERRPGVGMGVHPALCGARTAADGPGGGGVC